MCVICLLVHVEVCSPVLCLGLSIKPLVLLFILSGVPLLWLWSYNNLLGIGSSQLQKIVREAQPNHINWDRHEFARKQGWVQEAGLWNKVIYILLKPVLQEKLYGVLVVKSAVNSFWKNEGSKNALGRMCLYSN